MSHVVQIETQVRDAAAVEVACQRLALPPPQARRVSLFTDVIEGLAVELPGWRYPVVCDLASGSVRFDNYGGKWGDQRELNRFLQAYATEKAKIEARKKGYSVTEQPLQDGSIQLTIQVSGGAA
jgi:hypothetical protein